jgi:YVTN family beta-propeller protein
VIAITRQRIAATFGVIALSVSAYPALAGGNVYIPLGSTGKIIVVDDEKDSIVETIDGLTAVHGLAGTPDGRHLIAGSFEEREAGDSAPEKPLNVSEEDHAAHHGAPSVGPKVEDETISTVSIVRASDGAVVRRVDVPGSVHHVAVSPDGRFAAVTHPNAGKISAIDLGSYELIVSVETGPLPNYAAFSPDGNRLYVSNAGNDTVSALNTLRWNVRWSVVVGASPEHVVLSKDGSRLYVNNVDDGTVSVVATDEQSVLKTLPVGATPHGIDLSDDGRTLFVAVLGKDKLLAIDLITGDYRGALLVPAPYHLAAIRGTGKLYVSSADEPKIWVVDQRSLAVLGEIPIGGKGHQMVQAPGS